MKNIICIELTKYNHQKLKEVSELLSLNFRALMNRKELGDDRIWISPEGNFIAHTTKKNKSKILFTSNYIKEFLDIKPIQKSEISRIQVDLSIDSILEKIMISGIESLTKEEKEFLNKYNKY